VLDHAQLQGAWFSRAQLQGASLVSAQLQGARFDGANLQGAALDYAQLQGIRLDGARLEGASLRHAFVWRADSPTNTNGAFVDAPEPGPKYLGIDCPYTLCEWSETSFAALINSVPRWPDFATAVDPIETLGKKPFNADESSAKAWTDLAAESARLAGSYGIMAQIPVTEHL
jgi:hypothetical protein